MDPIPRFINTLFAVLLFLPIVAASLLSAVDPKQADALSGWLTLAVLGAAGCAHLVWDIFRPRVILDTDELWIARFGGYRRVDRALIARAERRIHVRMLHNVIPRTTDMLKLWQADGRILAIIDLKTVAGGAALAKRLNATVNHSQS